VFEFERPSDVKEVMLNYSIVITLGSSQGALQDFVNYMNNHPSEYYEYNLVTTLVGDAELYGSAFSRVYPFDKIQSQTFISNVKAGIYGLLEYSVLILV